MSEVLVTNIGHLTTHDGDPITGAAMLIDDGRIAWVGPADQSPVAGQAWDAGGRCVIPGFVDSHAHMVFAGDRADEFAARMAGRSYSAGGIRSTVAATRAASDEHLGERLDSLIDEMRRSGITTFETKSGYGLTTHDEQRSLQIAAQRTPHTTFLGAHVVPEEYSGRTDDYVALVIDEMLPACSPYATGVDVFCDIGAFDADQSIAVLNAGRELGLTPRVHANQLAEGPGVRVAAEVKALSADHCTHLTDTDIDILGANAIVATLLPGAEFSTRSPYPNARRLLDAGVTVALATDCNPGSSYTTSMPLCIALAVRDMQMTFDEALTAATLGGAQALGLDDVGHLRVGAKADFVVLDAPTPIHLAYRPGVDLIHSTWTMGVRYRGDQ